MNRSEFFRTVVLAPLLAAWKGDTGETPEGDGWTRLPSCAVDNGHPWYSKPAPDDWFITLNGVEQKRVVAASEAHGIVHRHQTDTNGATRLTPDRMGVEQEILPGDVKIWWRPNTSSFLERLDRDLGPKTRP